MTFSTDGIARSCATHPKRTLAASLVAVLVSLATWFVLAFLFRGRHSTPNAP